MPNLDRTRQAITLGGLFVIIKHAGYDPKIVNNGAADTLVITDNGIKYRLVISPYEPPAPTQEGSPIPG